MPIIAPKQVVPATTIDADDVNAPVNTVANLVNGNLDQDNIKDGGITSDKLAPNAVGSSEKIADGVVLPRHLDFPALGAVSASSTSALELTTSSQDILSVDISGFPDGSLLECCGMVFANGTATETGLFADIDGTLEVGHVGNWGRTLTIAGRVVTKTAGKISIALRARKDNSTTLTTGVRQLLIKRIG